MDREQYEKDLERRQKAHLEKVNGRNWRPCMHDSCKECCGTGVRSNGTACVHMISCPCPKCSPCYMGCGIAIDKSSWNDQPQTYAKMDLYFDPSDTKVTCQLTNNHLSATSAGMN